MKQEENPVKILILRDLPGGIRPLDSYEFGEWYFEETFVGCAWVSGWEYCLHLDSLK